MSATTESGSLPAAGTRGGAAADLLRWIHVSAGVAGLLTFLLTGQFMDTRLDHLVGMPDGPRALYRSAHIYILFAALLNLLLGAYLVPAAAGGWRVVQYLASALLLGATVLFIYGFFVETPPGVIERPMIRTAIEVSLAGVLVHAAAGVAVHHARRAHAPP